MNHGTVINGAAIRPPVYLGGSGLRGSMNSPRVEATLVLCVEELAARTILHTGTAITCVEALPSNVFNLNLLTIWDPASS